MSKSSLPTQVDADPDNDNDDAVSLPPNMAGGDSRISTAAEVRQGHTGDGVRYVLIFSLAGAAVFLAVVVMLFAR